MGKGDDKPRGRMSAYAFFVQTCREEHKKKHPDETVIFAEFSRRCADRWKVMSVEWLCKNVRTEMIILIIKFLCFRLCQKKKSKDFNKWLKRIKNVMNLKWLIISPLKVERRVVRKGNEPRIPMHQKDHCKYFNFFGV